MTVLACGIIEGYVRGGTHLARWPHCGRDHGTWARLLEQDVRRDAASPMQAPAHRQGERAFAGEHRRRMAAEICFGDPEDSAPLFHTKFDGINDREDRWDGGSPRRPRRG